MMFSFEVEKSTPYAPKELNGEYRLVINGRKMRVEKLDDGTKARATCHKADNCNSVKDAAAYRKGCKPVGNMIGEVLYIAPYSSDSDHMLAYIRVGAPFDLYNCYLIDVDGLE